MAYVVTDACTKDFVCVAECATAAIAPSQGDPKAGTVSQVFINPDECIDCGSCADLCAQNAHLQTGERFEMDCFKANGKAAGCSWQGEMVFKLTGRAVREQALAIGGAHLLLYGLRLQPPIIPAVCTIFDESYDEVKPGKSE